MALNIINHPLVLHKLSIMRDKETSTIKFRELLQEISMLMGYEITRDLPLTYEDITTPLMPMRAPMIAGKKVVVVPILRAGMGMVDGLTKLIPSATSVSIATRRHASPYSITTRCQPAENVSSSSPTPCLPLAVVPAMPSTDSRRMVSSTSNSCALLPLPRVSKPYSSNTPTWTSTLHPSTMALTTRTTSCLALAMQETESSAPSKHPHNH